MGLMSIDLLKQLFTSPSWSNDIVGRFGSIMIKAYSVSRQILALDDTDGTVPSAVSIAHRWDSVGAYNVINTTTYDGLMSF